MKNHLFLFFFTLLGLLQSCSISKKDYSGPVDYNVARTTQSITHVPMLPDSYKGIDISAEIDIYSLEDFGKKPIVRQFSLHCDHYLNSKYFLSESIMYYSNNSPLGDVERRDYFYNEFSRGGLFRLAIGTINQKRYFYYSSAFSLMGGMDKVDIDGSTLVRKVDETYYSWVQNDAAYDAWRVSVGNISHIGFNWPKNKLGIGMIFDYTIYNRDMISGFNINEVANTGLFGTEYSFQRIGYINSRSFIDLTPFIVYRLMPLEHISFEVQASLNNVFLNNDGRYPRDVSLKFGLMYNVFPNF